MTRVGRCIKTRHWALGALVLAVLAVGLDATVLSVALPKAPGGAGFLGSLANHGAAEFRLVLHRSDDTGRGDGKVG
jgi:hypothetical protein